jgi:hypothetical protein
MMNLIVVHFNLSFRVFTCCCVYAYLGAFTSSIFLLDSSAFLSCCISSMHLVNGNKKIIVGLVVGVIQSGIKSMVSTSSLHGSATK